MTFPKKWSTIILTAQPTPSMNCFPTIPIILPSATGMLLCTLPAYEKNFVLPLIRNNEVPFFIFDPEISWQAQILEQMTDIYVHRKSKTAPLRILSSFSLIWALLLRETDMTITEIALSTGFGSASYYAESFRKWAGMSPGEFRKMV